MRRYRIKEYDYVDGCNKTVSKRYRVQFYNGWFYGWQGMDASYKTEKEARDMIQLFKLQDDVDSGKGVRYIDVD